ncbi:MAG: YerC/YecD family TrpR-related protein [Patescibacteria group bacterium]
MAKFNLGKLKPKDKMELLDLLWASIEQLKSREEIKNFFKDLLSESESVMLARRILVARELLEGKTYEEIMKKYGVGKSTLASVHYWLQAGFGGYEKALKNFDKTVKERLAKIERAKEIDRKTSVMAGSFTAIRRKYPLHFALLNLILDRKKK